jgi:hypothetical protein
MILCDSVLRSACCTGEIGSFILADAQRVGNVTQRRNGAEAIEGHCMWIDAEIPVPPFNQPSSSMMKM